MKIIHCADIHLDSRLSSNFDTKKAKERRDEILATFIRMVDYAEKNGVEAILICGDLFDTKKVSSLVRNTFRDVVCTHPSIVFFYLKGNHDSDNLFEVFDEIPDNLILFGDSISTYFVGKSFNVCIHGVELTKENSSSVFDTFVPDPSCVNILMLHGMLADSNVKDKAEVINLKSLRNKGLSYVALGHIHEHKEGMLEADCKYCYSGCLEARGFDEPSEHGFVLLEIDERTKEVRDSFVPFSTRFVYEIEVDITNASGDSFILDSVKRALSNTNATENDYVKIVLTGTVDVECEKDAEFIKKALEDSYYLVKVVDMTKTHVDPLNYRYDMSLKGEFVRTVFASDLSLEEKNEVIKIGLDALLERRPY